MPFFDSWSLDAWVMSSNGHALIPCRMPSVQQRLVMGEELCVETRSETETLKLTSQVRVVRTTEGPVCELDMSARASKGVEGVLVVSLRPYNPEGISFINDVKRLGGRSGWKVNQEREVLLSASPEQFYVSTYDEGDVYHKILSKDTDHSLHTRCEVGMASAAALFRIDADSPRDITASVPLVEEKATGKESADGPPVTDWMVLLRGRCELTMSDREMVYLYDAALRTLILHTPDDVYAGPYTYKRFWFRDAAFILHAMLSAGLSGQAERILRGILPRQQRSGYFVSQFGEWDSNGQMLWLMEQFCRLTGSRPRTDWRAILLRGYGWIRKKRRTAKGNGLHQGLLPAGFSAEHLGPNDYYYWDDFWGVAGLKAAASLLEQLGERDHAEAARRESDDLMVAIERSLQGVAARIGSSAMPASPYRRLDSGAIGSLSAGYPLGLFEPNDPRLCRTAEFLVTHCLSRGGFFHDIAHSGINPYLTLHLAQVFLRNGNLRFSNLMETIKSLASSTGQWPEAIHPRTGCGCMGDGQHVWAAAEWILMVRNCLLREEGDDCLVLCSGITETWCGEGETVDFGPAPTRFGVLRLHIENDGTHIAVSWEGDWDDGPPRVEVRFPGRRLIVPQSDESSVSVPRKGS